MIQFCTNINNMIQLKKNQLHLMEAFTSAFHDTTSYTVIQGIGGSAWVDNIEQPRTAITLFGDFCILAGEPVGDGVEEQLMEILDSSNKTWSLFVGESEEWIKFFRKSSMFYESERYRLSAKKDSFDRKLLQGYVDALPSEFMIEPINEKWYDRVLREEWSADLCSNFSSKEEYLEHGVGFVITSGDTHVAGVSTYSYYDKGIEIEIDTKEEYRKKGFATVLGAKMVLACLEKGLYPSWEAANLISAKVAEKLGYKFETPYPVFSNVEIHQLKLGE